MDNETVTLDAKTAAEIRKYLKWIGPMFYPSDEADRMRWIAALTPREKIVPDGPFDEYYNGETE